MNFVLGLEPILSDRGNVEDVTFCCASVSYLLEVFATDRLKISGVNGSLAVLVVVIALVAPGAIA